MENNNNNKKEKFKSVGLLSTKNTLDLIHQIDIIDQIDMIDYIAASYPYIIFLAANIIYRYTHKLFNNNNNNKSFVMCSSILNSVLTQNI